MNWSPVLRAGIGVPDFFINYCELLPLTAASCSSASCEHAVWVGPWQEPGRGAQRIKCCSCSPSVRGWQSLKVDERGGQERRDGGFVRGSCR